MAGRIIKAKYINFLPGSATVSSSLYNVKKKDFHIDSAEKKFGSVDVGSVEDSFGNVDVKNLRRKVLNDLEKGVVDRQKKIDILDNQIKSLEGRYEGLLEQRSRETEDLLNKTKTQIESELKSSSEQAEKTKSDAEKQAKDILDEAVEKARICEEEMTRKRAEYEQNIRSMIENQTVEKVLQQGEAEIKRLTSLLEHVVKETINKRNEIIDSARRYLVDISMAVAKKVVKKISQNDKELVLRNIKEALAGVKNVVHLTIRVNPLDWDISEKYRAHLSEIVESLEEINFLQDPTIEVGGCVVETDLGVIDARISSQLSEIERALEEVDPIRKDY